MFLISHCNRVSISMWFLLWPHKAYAVTQTSLSTTSNQSSSSIQSLSLTALKAPSFANNYYIDLCMYVCKSYPYVYVLYMSSYAYNAGYSKRPHYSYVQLQFTAHEYDNASASKCVFESEYVYVANLNSNSNSTSTATDFGGVGVDWWQFKQLRRNLCYTICAMTTNTHEVFRFAKLFLWRRLLRFLIRFSAIADISPRPLSHPIGIWSELKWFAYALLTHIYQIQPHLTKWDANDDDDDNAHV